jgi:hypothetical protein
MQLFGRLMLEWSLGAVVVGIMLALATFALSHALFRYIAEPTNPAATPAD